MLQLASDSGTAALLADLSNAASAAYAFILHSTRWASSEIDSHCQMGKRYTRASLEAIVTAADAAPTNETLNKRAGVIRQLCADLTYGHLMSRRGQAAEALKSLAPRYEMALLTLEKLAQGLQVFDLDANINAGKPHRVTIGLNNKYTPSADNRLFGIWSDSPFTSFFGRW